MKNFTLYWPQLHNCHLTKDIGAIPFVLRKYYSYNTCILVSNEGNSYEDAHIYLDDLPIKYINGNTERLEAFLKSTDILMVVGIYNFNFNIIELYKKINPLGKVYLKTDLNINWLNNLNLNDHELSILKLCDLISVECKTLCNLADRILQTKTEYIPNGYLNFSSSKYNKVTYDEKENIILTVGRIGTYQKDIEVLLEAFKLCEKSIPNWKLKIVGSIDNDFKPYINDLFLHNPYLSSKIDFTGSISNRLVLNDIYRKSKIFCLTSRYEGFPLVFPEATINGCYIISTDIEPAYDITNNKNYGEVFPIHNSEILSSLLTSTCNNEPLLQKVCEETQIYSKEHFDWIKICGRLDKLLN